MFNLSISNSRRMLYRFSLNFFLINTLLSLLIGLNYIQVLPHFQTMAANPLDGAILWFFFIISFVTQIAILYFFCFLLINIVLVIVPNYFIIFTLSIIVGSALIFSLIADNIAFNFYHMHYASVGWEILKANAFSQVISFSLYEILGLIIVISILLFIEAFIAWRTWQYVKKKSIDRLNYECALIIIFIIFCVVISYSLNFMARQLPAKYGLSARNAYLMVKATRFIPYYDEVYQFIMPVNNAVRHIETHTGTVDLQAQQSNRPLAYPKHVLAYKKTQQQLNILVIVIDTWRYDAMNSKATPTIYQFAKKSLQFQNHWSGGNCTKAGLFSLFYGIPENYWEAMLQQKHGPQLIHQLIKANYKMAIFASAQLNFPAFDKTIFREVKPLLHVPGDTTIARDQAITQEFKNFLSIRNSQQPFFGFIFYDAAHNYCEATTSNQHPFKPWIKMCNRLVLNIDSNPFSYMNRYLNAVFFIDNEIKQILASLEQQHLMKNTIVIITADHGEEINDKHSGYWQHASAYTSYQLHIPLLVYWPGLKPTIYSHFTTHYDFVPTLMMQALNCKNPLQDYTIGQSLFSIGHRPILISGSYADYAIITHAQIFRIYRGGDYVINDERGQPIDNVSLKIVPLQQAFSYLNAYFK
jgi:uncharacterized protein